MPLRYPRCTPPTAGDKPQPYSRKFNGSGEGLTPAPNSYSSEEELFLLIFNFSQYSNLFFISLSKPRSWGW